MRNISTALVVIGLLAPGSAHPLGIGEIKLHSYLNQPLNAEVPLVLSGEQLSQLRIGLAAPGEFAKVGLERSPALSKLRFDAVQRRDGSFAVRVRSIDVISEPYLSFVMELTWPEGRMLRSFTLLLDPPDVLAAPARTARLELPVDRSDGQTHSGDGRLPDPLSMVPGSGTQRVAPMGPSEQLYGPVGRNEKLWKIAEQLKPDPSVSTHEMMMALFRLNPRAFSRPSVNALNAGAYLRVPGPDEISKPSFDLRQGGDYPPQMDRNGHLSQRVAALPRSEDPNSTPAAVRSGRDERGSPANASQAQRPAESPASPALETLRRENEQIRTRLVALERRVTELTQLLDERKPTSPGAPSDPPAATAVPAPIAEETPVDGGSPAARDTGMPARRPVEADAPSQNMPAAAAPGTAQTPAAAGALQPQLAPPAQVAAEPSKSPKELAARTNPAPASGPAESGASGLLPWLLGLSALLCASLIGVAVRRRLTNARAQVPAHRVEESPESPPAKSTARSAPAGLINPGASEPLQASTPVTPGDARLPDPAISEPEPQDADALFEADIYLSYGKYRQAEEAVNKAIELAPNRPQHYLKLLEIYKAAKDADAFVRLVGKLKAEHRISDPDFWPRVADLQRDFAFPDEDSADESPSPATPDATDDLIAKLKQFSLENHDRGAHTPDTDALPPGQTANSPPARTATDASAADSLAPNSLRPESTRDGSAPAADDENLIPYEPAAQPQSREEPLAIDCNGDAARSIEDLLKELSAMHFEEHLNTDPKADAAPNAGVFGRAAHDERDAAVRMGSEAATGSEPASETVTGVPDDLEAKLDLARAYADMSDGVQARAVLSEVIAEGNPAQRSEAQALLSRLG